MRQTGVHREFHHGPAVRRDPPLFIKRTASTAALLVIPRAGHTITSEEPAAFNAALADLFAAAEAGTWLAHKPRA